MDRGRLVLTEPGEGAWNMAVDEALMHSVAESGVPVLRLYSWAPATLSLGYFQAAEERQTHTPSLDCPWVRRSTGGGAIMHDRDLTYSLIVPEAHRGRRGSAQELYQCVHGAAIEVLAEIGCSAARYGDLPAASPADVAAMRSQSALETSVGEGRAREQQRDPFLCFLRRAADDLIVAGQKILGSAQRRRHGALLQHGSFLLGRSPFAPELPGLAELASQPAGKVRLGAVSEQLPTFLGERLGVDWQHSSLSSEEADLAHRFQAEKFSSEAWNSKR